jgi:hypothetical protein
MKYRKLRIAWSLVWGVGAVLVCASWVRSYHVVESIVYQITSTRIIAAPG